jgi:2-iminoacetate synthase
MDVKKVFDEDKIYKILNEEGEPLEYRVNEILKKAALKKGLELDEVGCLLNVEDVKLVERIFEVAKKIKRDIYGERLVFFAPLYVSSYCVNDCEYCGFHCRNTAPRNKLSMEELEEQVRFLEDMGHKRLVLEFGEDPNNAPIDYVVDVIKKIYDTKSGNGEIRRVNVNIAATSVKNYKKLKDVGIGTYQLFQETYHRKTYEALHKGPKADFERQLFAHNRAFEGGLDDVGLGVLFGLYDYKFEVLGLVSHAKYLDKKFGVGPHTLSVPRFQPADSVTSGPEYPVSDNEFLKIVAILRLAVPYTGMIISTREGPEIRAKAFDIGISQTSAGSKTSLGGYGKESELDQFSVSDHRNVEEVLMGILKQDLLPSFCTACYREGRTGKEFMEIAKPGNIHNFCRPNAIFTFQEYLEDYAKEDLKKLGTVVLEKYLEQIPDEKVKEETKKRLERIKAGERDLYF